MKSNLVAAQLFKHLPGQCQCKVTAQLHTAWAGLDWAGLETIYNTSLTHNSGTVVITLC